MSQGVALGLCLPKNRLGLRLPAIPEANLARPPRLNMGTPAPETTQTFTAPPPGAAFAPNAPATQQQNQSTSQSPELREIFESAGYTIKSIQKIGTTPISIMAIGTNETIWIGGIGITTDAIQSAVDRLQQIFLDTLDNIEIMTIGFTISAPDADTPSAPEILTFDSIDSLRKYISEHTNPPLDEESAENFEAFSSYISTVIEYLGKM